MLFFMFGCEEFIIFEIASVWMLGLDAWIMEYPAKSQDINSIYNSSKRAILWVGLSPRISSYYIKIVGWVKLIGFNVRKKKRKIYDCNRIISKLMFISDERIRKRRPTKHGKEPSMLYWTHLDVQMWGLNNFSTDAKEIWSSWNMVFKKNAQNSKESKKVKWNSF